MIIKEHIWCYERLRKYYNGKMLVLGNQETRIGDPKAFFQVDSYETLDPDNGTYTNDLTDNINSLEEKFDVVFNIGTLEHIWDAHKAYSNTAKLVKLNGHFLFVGPVSGWENHGIHITSSWAILSFFQNNGFEILDHWLIDSNFNEVHFTKKDRTRNIELWFAAKKIESKNTFVQPTQFFVNNRPLNT